MNPNISRIKLNQTTIFGSKRKELPVDSVATRFKRDPDTHLPTAEIEGYAVNAFTARGEVQTVKLPLEVESKIEEIRSALMKEKIVKVTFTNLVGKFWALLDQNSGRVLQGISTTATDVEIFSIEDPVDEDIDMDDVVL
ncbi:MAG: hypothetical protein K6G69_01540 [Lachnospiraceae bacterium]|nr:hypothetical protein [Lachnospiraceae bacterium]